MAIYTSNFHLSGHHPLAVAISNGTRGFTIRKYLPLVPPWTLVKDSKAGLVADTDFNLAYFRQLNALDAKKVVEDLYGMTGKQEVILLCWEAPGEYCHRRLAARWLERELGIEVPELKVDKPYPRGEKPPKQQALFK